MDSDHTIDHPAPTANAEKRRRNTRARLKRANRRLKERMGRYHRLFLMSTGVAVILALVLGFVALDEPEPDPVLLGTGRAGLMTPAAAVDSATALAARTPPAPAAAAPEAEPEVDEPAPADIAPAERGRAITGGEASYYGNELAGRPTASGEAFNPSGLTAAHRTLPLGSRVRVTNQRNGESVVVRINDRGPYSGNRVIDLSHGAAREIGIARSGVGQVRLELLN